MFQMTGTLAAVASRSDKKIKTQDEREENLHKDSSVDSDKKIKSLNRMQ